MRRCWKKEGSWDQGYCITMPIVMRAASIFVLAAALLPRPAAAQSEQPPVFKAGVEVLEVDVNVVDRNGVPVPDLRAPEFAVTVDGQPRRVVSAEFVADVPASRAQEIPKLDPFISNNTDRRP